MKILLTGATGYIGKRLLPVLVENGHEVVCFVRDSKRFVVKKSLAVHIRIVEGDYLNPETLGNIPNDIDVAYYLIHSMSSNTKKFDEMEALSARNFREAMQATQVKQVIYLSGIVNDKNLSKHLKSRKIVEETLSGGRYALTTLRAGIIVGSGSASFEIIRDLVEKLPVMIAPKWLNTKTQPIAIRDVIQALLKVVQMPETYNKSFDIGGPDILTYKEMLLQFAEVRQMKRWIILYPFFSPRISSYWLYFVTQTSYKLAINLVASMKVEVVCRNNSLFEMLHIEPISYKQAIRNAFDRIMQNEVVSSWKDSYISSSFKANISDYIEVPVHGCLTDEKRLRLKNPDIVMNRLWAIGGETGWYYANLLWRIRGLLDKAAGGVGLRRGRTHPSAINAGDALDFWRVLYASKEQRRLLLYAEMRLPGDAWLEFFIDDHNVLHQKATFRPNGLAGRFYWYVLIPAHAFVFGGMIKGIRGEDR
jgi:uncharacterized protein YbjT (DUF2867 family)